MFSTIHSDSISSDRELEKTSFGNIALSRHSGSYVVERVLERSAFTKCTGDDV
jgi:hypothetical protein